MYEVQLTYGLGQPHQHVQLHHPEVLGRLQVQVLILIHIRCRYFTVNVFDSKTLTAYLFVVGSQSRPRQSRPRRS